MEFIPSETFPYQHLIVLATILFSSSISMSNLFPYVGFMVVKLGVAHNTNDAGYTAGYIASAFMVGRLMSSIFWGQTADRIGRKPVLYIGCFSVAFFSVLFGLSTSFWAAIVFRFFLGLFNPLAALSRTLVSEICSKKFESTAMGIITGCWSLGFIVGPALGGLLADPALLYPRVFGSNKFLLKFPYFVPNAVVAFVACAGMIALKLSNFPETLRTKVSPVSESSTDTDHRNNSQKSSTAIIGAAAAEKITLCQLLRMDGVAAVLSTWFLCSLSQTINDELFSLWAMSSRDTGGLFLTSAHIGNIMSLVGFGMVFFTLLAYPIIANKLGPRLSFVLGNLLLIPYSLVVTFANRLHVREEYLIVIVAAICFTGRMGLGLAISSCSLLVNQLVDSSLRATINGVSMTVGSLARAVGPIMASVLFAWSISHRRSGPREFPFEYHFVFLLMAALSGLNTLIIMNWVKANKSEGTNVVTDASTASIVDRGEKQLLNKVGEANDDEKDLEAFEAMRSDCDGNDSASIELINRRHSSDARTNEEDSETGASALRTTAGAKAGGTLHVETQRVTAAAAAAMYDNDVESPLHSHSPVTITKKAISILSGHSSFAVMRGGATYSAVATQEEQGGLAGKG